MLRALWTAASGMNAQQAHVDTIANNLSNVNTAGFKRGRAEFQDLLYARLHPPLDSRGHSLSVGQGARLSGVNRIQTGGALEVTGSPSDLAIQGEGFFRIRRSDGSEAYTRDGSFRLDAQRRLTTATGDLLLGQSGPVTVPLESTTPEILANGSIRLGGDAATGNGQIMLAIFANPAGLETLGGNLLGATAASGALRTAVPGEGGAGHLVQGHLEGSNVQSVEEMIRLITAQRAYEINSRLLQSADEMMSAANNIRRG